MCMSLFEFAYLGFEEEWDFLSIVCGFFFPFNVLAIFISAIF